MNPISQLAALTLALTLTAPGLARAEPKRNDIECTKDLMFVFDASGSMGTTDLTAKVPHIQRVKNALHHIVSEIPQSRRIGLIVYGQGAYNRCDTIELKLQPQTNAGAAIVEAVDKITPAGKTPLTEAVKDAAQVLDYKNNPSVIVLLTDGEETCGGDACALADRLRREAKDLTVHVIGYRHAQASGLGSTFTARCLAEVNGGLYLPVEKENEIITALRRTITCPMESQNDTWQAGPSKIAASQVQSFFPTASQPLPGN